MIDFVGMSLGLEHTYPHQVFKEGEPISPTFDTYADARSWAIVNKHAHTERAEGSKIDWLVREPGITIRVGTELDGGEVVDDWSAL